MHRPDGRGMQRDEARGGPEQAAQQDTEKHGIVELTEGAGEGGEQGVALQQCAWLFRAGGRQERLCDLTEDLETVAGPGMRRQSGPAILVEQPRMCFPGETECAGNGDIGVADVIAEPEL